MSSKSSPRTRKLKHSSRTDDLNNSKYETFAQVHRIPKSETSSEKDNQSISLSLSRTDNSEDGESNKAFQMEEYNENFNNSSRNVHNTPSREISVDGEAQINTKILSLIETEMRKDIKRQSHFTESRPQSLSFYEDEKIPEELSGNLELLSPEERKHYRRRKDHTQLLDSDERKVYNAIQDLYNSRDVDGELTSTKKKSRRKRHNVDPELGIGDSREMMIPREKKKSKKKKRESTSPMSSNNKRKHKRREEENEAVKNDVTIALEELHDDVFENNHEEYSKGRKSKDTQDGNDRLYVQKKNKFEVLSPNSRPSSRAMYKDPNLNDMYNRESPKAPLDIALFLQKYCIYIFLPCHGLLAGLTFGQWLYLICNDDNENIYFFDFYSKFNDVYIGLFHFLITICLVSSFDRMDIAHINRKHFLDFSMPYRIIGNVVILFYIVALILHFSVSNTENRLSLLSMKDNITVFDLNMTTSEIRRWNRISLWRFITVTVPWILVAAKSSITDNMLHVHLHSMLKYLPEK